MDGVALRAGWVEARAGKCHRCSSEERRIEKLAVVVRPPDNGLMAKAGTDFRYEEAELVLGLVAPVGTDFDKFVETLGTCLKAFRYKPSPIRLSSLAASLIRSSAGKGGGEYERLTRLMDAGNAARAGGGDVLALAAAAEIHRARSTNKSQQKEPLSRTAHIVRSLKHPGEVQTLRRIYGRGFFLIGVVASEADRRTFLAARKGCTQDEINTLLKRDEDEGDGGQRTRDTFHLADTFLAIDDQRGLQRFLGLVFGSPHVSRFDPARRHATHGICAVRAVSGCGPAKVLRPLLDWPELGLCCQTQATRGCPIVGAQDGGASSSPASQQLHRS